ncbi:thiol reductant ABC exporter subunit CydC [Dermabacter hominis]|uniref:thiol reductant ABC exporter subunit CydC n=1 Tax=Dermabacter hominis TaxID=36740 RepID=UPI0021B07144|nr:thiol reductant ABC exporter subunit CydC [Dermabacter hominis]MCT2025760.1 thiol reductant ABC exporter subunit CydC [Dermabacter hominis]
MKISSRALSRMHELMEIGPRQLTSAVAAGAATLASAFALAVVSGYLITKSWTMPPVLDLSVAVVSVRALGISRGVFRYFERLLTHDAALTGVARLRTNMYAGLASAPSALAGRLKRGDLLARIGDDAEDMANDVIRAVVPALVALVMAVAILATIAPFSPIAALAMLVGLAFATIIAPFFAFKAALVAERELVEARSRLNTLSLFALDNADVLRVKGQWNSTLADLGAAQEQFDAALDKAAVPSAFARSSTQIAMIPALLGSILAAGAVYNLETTGLLGGLMGHTAGIIGVIILAPLSSFEAASVLPQAASQRARSIVAAERLHELDPGNAPIASAFDTRAGSSVRDALRAATEDAQSAIEGRRAVGPASNDVAPAPARTERPSPAVLSASGLTTGWSAEHPLAHGLELSFTPGSRTLVYGASGRGKSTLGLTLAGLLTPLSGRVLYGDTPLTSFSPAALASRVSFYAEDAHVFATSLRENIRVVRGDLTDAEIHHALDLAGLGAWVSGLASGLDTILGSGGEDVSGGERRRLLLARAIAHGAPVTILDEPTEHLNLDLAAELMDGILTPGAFFAADATVIVITHDQRFKESGAAVLDLDAHTTHEGSTHVERHKNQ